MAANIQDNKKMVKIQLERSIVFCKEKPWHPHQLQGYCTLSEGRQIISCPNLDTSRSEQKEWYKVGTGIVVGECYGCGYSKE